VAQGHVAAPEGQAPAIPLGGDRVDATALLGEPGRAAVGGVEHQAVARLGGAAGGLGGGAGGGAGVGARGARGLVGRRWCDHDGPAALVDAHDRAEAQAAVAGRAPAHGELVIGAGDEPGAESARVHLLEVAQEGGVGRGVRDLADGGFGDRADSLVHRFRSHAPRRIDRRPVRVGGERHVVGVLVAALDLEGVDADVDELGHLRERHEVAGRQQVALVEQRVRARRRPPGRRRGGRPGRTGRGWPSGRPTPRC
jgi:hypothetical protein